MLEVALKLDRVHTFGNISLSQLLERMNWVTEMAIINANVNEFRQKKLMLIVVISLGNHGLLVETEPHHEYTWEEWQDMDHFLPPEDQVNAKPIPSAIDCSQLYKNFV